MNNKRYLLTDEEIAGMSLNELNAYSSRHPEEALRIVKAQARLAIEFAKTAAQYEVLERSR